MGYGKSTKSGRASVLDYGKMVKNVNDLVNMNLIQVEKDNCAVRIHTQLWTGKDKVFINNWCKNILVYWCIMEGIQDSLETLDIYDIERPGIVIGKFNLKNGYIAA